jgi:hypothetical protein
VREAGEPQYGTFGGREVILFPFNVPAGVRDVAVAAKPHVAVDETGQIEGRVPFGAPQPLVIGWVGPEGEEIADRRLQVLGREGEMWAVAVVPAPDTATVVRFELV